MKKIEAIIRKTKFNEVREALHQTGIDFFSFWEVTGVGQARESRVYRGIAYDTTSIERLMLSIVIRDKNIEPTVNAIMTAARTGEIGDGRIFVSDMDEAYRIRTGEKGEKTLYCEEEDKLKE